LACFRTEPGAIVLSVRLTPKANRDSVEGIGTLADGQEVALARVRALPAEGAANAALIALLAKTFHRPKSSVELVRGAAQRLKHVRISGDPAAFAGIVATWKPK
jgi:uncharacterized protein (TIGR00251 family)